jgi:hypothetical protein
LQALAEAFARTAAGRDVALGWTVQPRGEFDSTSVAENAERYDVMIIDHPHVIEAATAGALAPIEIGRDDHYIGPCQASYRWQGRQWAVPVDASSHMAAYREDRVNPPPRTWTQLFEQAEHGARFGVPLRGVHGLMALLTLLASMGTPFDAGAAEQERGAGLPCDTDLMRAAQLLQRIASVSLRTTVLFNLVSPRPCRVCFWSFGRPMPLRSWVTFSVIAMTWLLGGQFGCGLTPQPRHLLKRL